MTEFAEQTKNYVALYLSYDGLLDPLGQSQILPYLKRLSKKGIKYIVLSFEKETRFLSSEDVFALEKELESLGIVWKRLRYHKKPAVFASFFDIINGCLHSFMLIKKYGIKIIHARSYVVSLIALLLQKLCQVKFIFDMRGFWADERIEAGIWKRGSLLYKTAKYLEKIFLQNADGIVSLTQAAKNEIKTFSYFKTKKIDITCVPTCVDLGRFRCNGVKINQKLKGKFVLVYTGSISTWCMPNQMIDFFGTILKNIPHAHLLVLTQERELFEDIFKDSGCKDDSMSVVSLNYESVPDYLSLAQVGLAFYRPGYSRKGCCPTKVGEYLACGLPVVINSGIGDTEEITKREEVGVIVKDFSPASYEKASKKLINLLEEKEILRKRCRSTAERYFSLKEGIEKYWQMYQKLFKI